MSHFGLHAHDLDPSRATGIARYARGLASGLEGCLGEDESFTLISAQDDGSVEGPHHVLERSRRSLYARWLLRRGPRMEDLVPGLDLLHCTAPIVPVSTRLPLVVTVHDLMGITHPQWYTRKAVLLFRAAISWTCRAADVIVVPTRTIGDQVVSVLGVDPDRVIQTGEGFDVRHFAGGDLEEVLPRFGVTRGDYLVHVGMLSSRKGLTTLIEALPADGPVLVLIGPDGVGAEDVHRAAARKGAQVRLVGRLPDTDVGALVRGARALVHPSQFEGFGLTVLEAMGVGTPVLASSAGALPEVVGDGGLLVEPNDVAGWREALERSADDALLALLRERGHVRVGAWTWDDAARRTLDVYRRVLA